MNSRLANFNAAVITNYIHLDQQDLHTAEPSSSHSKNGGNVYTAWWVGGGRLRATSQVFVTRTNVNKIEDYNHLN